MEPGTTLVIFASFFHRDEERLTYADVFAPELWLGEPAPDRWPLIPFSAGPVRCPAGSWSCSGRAPSWRRCSTASTCGWIRPIACAPISRCPRY
jgi:hypothetical protein